MQLSSRDLDLLITGIVFVVATLVAVVTYRVAMPFYPKTKAAIAWTVTCLLGLGGQFIYDKYNKKDAKGSADADGDGYSTSVFVAVMGMVAIVGTGAVIVARKSEMQAIDDTTAQSIRAQEAAKASRVFIAPSEPGVPAVIKPMHS